MIYSVRVKPLRLIPADRGRLMEILRSGDDQFIRFGQLYMTTAYPGSRERLVNSASVHSAGKCPMIGRSKCDRSKR